MLESIEIKNFSCIKHLHLQLNFAEGKAPNGYKESPLWPFIEAGKSTKSRLCPVMALYGPNASGKTTVLLAMRLLQQIVRTGWKKHFFNPNKISATVHDASLLSIVFWKELKRFSYSLEFGKNGIVAEHLECEGRKIFDVVGAKLAFLDEGIESLQDDVLSTFESRCIHAATKQQVNTLLNELPLALPGISENLLLAREFITSDLIFIDQSIDFYRGLELLADTFGGTESDNMQKAQELFVQYLKKLDFRIVGINIQNLDPEKSGLPAEILKLFEDVGNNFSLHVLETLHKTEAGEIVKFDISYESRGTQHLARILGGLLAAIRQGKTVLIDELDDSLHSLLVMELVKLFKEKRINENKAQLIFTIHNTDLLSENLLGLSEIGIVSQRGFEGSKLLRLVEIPRLRNSADFRRRYLRGEFGGIPFPYV